MDAPKAQTNGQGHAHTNGTYTNDSHTHGSRLDGHHTNSAHANDTYTNNAHTYVAHIDGITNSVTNGPQNGLQNATPPTSKTHTALVPIAICGMAMRLPGNVSNAEQLWDFLVGKKDARSTVPPERYNADAFHGEGRHGYFLKDIDLESFDASPFRVSRAEVQQMDPQHRLLLELTKECLETAGETDWRGKSVGCYIGTWGDDWKEFQTREQHGAGMTSVNGHADFMMANKISYEYDFHGPSLGVKSACSSSLVALHTAFRDLQAGEATSAIVGGVNMLLSPSSTSAMYRGGILSPNDSCRVFDADADGYARAEGANMVYLKPLDDAIRDGNPIRAVIRGASSNHDGRGDNESSMYYPSSAGQEDLIRKCYAAAGISDFGQTVHFETHGTGTPAGDPVETKAIANVWGEYGGIYIGSAKPNFGHSEGASGLTALIKCVLALEHRTIPPNIKFEKPNPDIPFHRGLRVPVDSIPWPVGRHERISINGFGLGGSNAHVILDSASSFGVGRLSSSNLGHFLHAAPRPRLLVLTASHPESVKAGALQHADFAESHPTKLHDMAYTLARHREHNTYRAFAVADGSAAPEFCTPAKGPAAEPDVVFVFTGQGAQWPSMGAKLLMEYPSVAQELALMDDALVTLGPEYAPAWKLADELLKHKGTSQVAKAEFAQPLSTAVQIIVVNLLRSWGIQPAAVVGHSSGEMAAAYASGALTLQQAIICSYVRGLVTKKMRRPGGMLAVALGKDAVTPYLVDGLVVACENSPSSVTLSGDDDKIDAVAQAMQKDYPDLTVRRLHVDKAYHSHHMKEVSTMYEEIISRHVSSAQASVPLYSSVSNKVITHAGLLNAPYWRSNMELPVLFNTAVAKLLHERQPSANTVLVEIGPHSTLAGPLRQITKAATADGVSYVPTLKRNEDDRASLLRTVGQLFLQGVKVSFERLMPHGNTLPNLPAYAWNRDDKFWAESRLIRDWRLRRFPHHELLGTPVVECSAVEPMWRNMLRVENVPWLRDHMIDRDVVLPGAAYVTMACEAMRQVSDATADDYSLRNVTLRSALTLPESSATEVLFAMQPVRLTKSLDSAWYEFTVYSYNGTSWTRHCSGEVRAGPATLPPEGREIHDLPRKVNEPGWYQAGRRHGMNFGPRFQGLYADAATAHPLKNVIVAHVSNKIPDVVQTEEPPYPHAIAIDYCMQLFPQSVHRGLERKLRGLRIPTFLGEVYVRRPSPSGNLTIEVSADENSRGDIQGNCLVIDDEGQVVVEMKTTRLSPLADESSNKIKDSFRVQWQPDLEFQDLSQLIKGRRSSTMREGCGPLQSLILSCCVESQHRLSGLEATSVEYLEKFRRWIDGQVDQAKSQGYFLVENPAAILELHPSERVKLIDDLVNQLGDAKFGPLAASVKRICDSVQDIYCGRTTGLDVLREGDLLTQVYNSVHEWDYRPFLRLLGHRTPHMRILEIGAGTGSSTDMMLQGLVSEYGDRLYSSYVFTDVSAGFFGAAKERFGHAHAMKFQTLDISRDPGEQGFELGSFDLVVASNVLHATPSLGLSLANARKLLRPNGKLLLQELHTGIKGANFVMGTLPGWWMGEADGRPDEPYVSTERWKLELANAGFAEDEASFVLDDEEPYQFNALIFASPKLDKKTTSTVSLLSGSPSGGVATSISEFLRSRGLNVQVLSLADKPTQGVISILDLEGKPFLKDISEDTYQQLKDFFINATGHVLWLTRPCQMGCSEPEYATSIGLTRVLRLELAIQLASLELDEVESDGAMDAILSVYQNIQQDTVEGSEVDPDREFAWSDGKIYTPRFHWFSVPEDMAAQFKESGATSSCKTLEIGKKGSLKSLKWVNTSMPNLGEDEVLLEIRTVGVNFKDLLVAMNIVEGTMGLGGAGIVRGVGSQVSGLSIGDRVVIESKHLYSTFAKANASHCFKIPDELSFEDAATMASVYVTVIYSLFNLARLEAGQSILIHSACGAIGLAAIQISQMVGAEIYASVGNDEKVQHLMNTFGIPRNRIFYSRDSSFLPHLMKETSGKGVDVVLNSLSGELLHASWNCVAEFGCMVELGKRDIIGHGRLAMDAFEKNRAFFGVDLSAISDKRPEVLAKLLGKMMGFYQQGLIRPIGPTTIFEATNVEMALREMQKGHHIGKHVVRMPEDASSLGTSSVVEELRFRPDVSYFLPGGLGGLGRSISTWMVEKGAKNLVYLSRSGGTRPEDKSLLEELAAAGCDAQAFQGSVGNIADVEHAVANAHFPVAGVLQMSMVLKDRMFENTTYKEWVDVVTPKVAGTWNLHKALQGHDLDFFVLFSSSSGVVGYKGQANYAAGGVFQDAFVQARHRQGLPASVIDVGPVEDIGYVAQNPQVRARLRQNLMGFTNEQGVLDALELAISKSSPAAGSSDPLAAGGATYANGSQFCLGFRTTMPLAHPNNHVPWKRDPRCAIYRNMDDGNELLTGGSDGSGADGDLHAKFRAFMADAEAQPGSIMQEDKRSELAHFIGATLCGFMMRPADEVDVKVGIAALGIDSLVAIELKNWFSQRLAMDVSVLEIMNAVSLLGLAGMVAERLAAKWGVGA